MLKLNGEGNNTTSTQMPPPDRDQESRHFESKLVQVLCLTDFFFNVYFTK